MITGASSGIGWALAKVLAAQGAAVGLVARRRERLAELAERIRAAGGITALAPADVGDRAQVRAALEDLRIQLGPVDLLVANAGVGMPTTLDPVNIEDIEAMFRVNVLGVVYAIETVLPEMLRRGCGHLAAISSLAAYKGFPAESAYCASKAAVNTYLEGLRIQLHHRGIAVTTICPGFVRTPMTTPNQFAMPWVLEADQAARRIAWALHRRCKVYDFPWPLAMLVRFTRHLPDWILNKGLSFYSEDPPSPSPGS